MLTTYNPLSNYFNSLREEKVIVDECFKNISKKAIKKAQKKFENQRQVTNEHLKELHSNIPM